MGHQDNQDGHTETKKDRRDVRETLVEKSLSVFPWPEISKVYSATPGMKMDAEGIDILIVLKTGVAIPLQVKSGQQTIGVVLPLSEEREKWPKRLAIVSRRMAAKLGRHFKKHPDVKCFLFVNRPHGFNDDDLKKLFRRLRLNPNETVPEQVVYSMKEISEEIRVIALLAAKHTCYELFYTRGKKPPDRQ